MKTQSVSERSKGLNPDVPRARRETARDEGGEVSYCVRYPESSRAPLRYERGRRGTVTGLAAST